MALADVARRRYGDGKVLPPTTHVFQTSSELSPGLPHEHTTCASPSALNASYMFASVANWTSMVLGVRRRQVLHCHNGRKRVRSRHGSAWTTLHRHGMRLWMKITPDFCRDWMRIALGDVSSSPLSYSLVLPSICVRHSSLKLSEPCQSRSRF